MSRNNNIRLLEGAELSSSKQASPNLHAQYTVQPSDIDSESLEPLSVLHSKSKFEW